MKRLIALGVFLFISLLSRSATAGPGDLIRKVYSEVKTGVEACGRMYLPGNDLRLPYDVRSRNVDEVIVAPAPNGDVRVGVLVDWDIRGEKLELEYALRNGAYILDVKRDYTFDDLTVTTPNKGQVMRSNTFKTSGGTVTTYWIQGREVSLADFEKYLDTEVIGGFVRYLCQ